jgi:TrmH family RNA methyltransferase
MIGNEGNGLTAEAIAACDYPLTIPMGGRAESLNAAAAAAILIWEMVRNEKA